MNALQVTGRSERYAFGLLTTTFPMRLFYSTLAVILAACASERPAQIGVTADAADADTVCTREYPTGSNIPLTSAALGRRSKLRRQRRLKIFVARRPAAPTPRSEVVAVSRTGFFDVIALPDSR